MRMLSQSLPRLEGESDPQFQKGWVVLHGSCAGGGSWWATSQGYSVVLMGHTAPSSRHHHWEETDYKYKICHVMSLHTHLTGIGTTLKEYVIMLSGIIKLHTNAGTKIAWTRKSAGRWE